MRGLTFYSYVENTYMTESFHEEGRFWAITINLSLLLLVK